MNENVGLIGFGIMGAAIATKLIDEGYAVLVHDKNAAAASRAGDAGCTVAETPAEVAKQARVILISLPKPEHVTSVVREGENCLLAGAITGSVIIDTSTVDPTTSQKNAEAAAKQVVGYLDCPVLGRPNNCGNWTLPTGGKAQDITIARPVLETFAAKIVHMGPSGHGNTVKLLNNLMFGAINSITCEIFGLSKRLGLAPELLFETIANSGASTVSNLFKELGPKIVKGKYDPNFSIDNLQKDIGLGIAMAEQSDMTLAISKTGQRLNDMARAAGFGQEDTAAVFKVYENAMKEDLQNETS